MIKVIHGKEPKKKYDFKIDSSTVFRNPFFKQDKWNENGIGEINYNYHISTMFIKHTENIDFRQSKEFSETIKKMKKAHKKHGKIRLICPCDDKICKGLIIKNYLKVVIK